MAVGGKRHRDCAVPERHLFGGSCRLECAQARIAGLHLGCLCSETLVAYGLSGDRVTSHPTLLGAGTPRSRWRFHRSGPPSTRDRHRLPKPLQTDVERL